MTDAAVNSRACHLSTVQLQQLNLACHPILDGFGARPYLVGSATTSPDFRDVDVRVMLADAEFDALFTGRRNLWGLMCWAISAYLERATGLPIDFQIQRATEANERFGSDRRNPLAIRPRPFAGGGDATGLLLNASERIGSVSECITCGGPTDGVHITCRTRAFVPPPPQGEQT